MLKNLTSYEIDSLPYAFNLTDGHAYRNWSAAEEAVIARAAELFKRANRRSQATIERAFIADFLRLARQTNDEASVGFLMCFTASMSFEVLANWLRRKRWSVTLIEPAFDNLADIFRRHDIRLNPFPEMIMEEPAETFTARLPDIADECVCLVTPNNPTGATLTEENLRRLAAFCAERGKLLVLDNCFRAYLPRDQVYDQYRIVIDSGVDFVMVEDTGKTWPTAEIKAPFFAVSRARGLFQEMYDIYTDFLLHVSPVSVGLAHQFIRLSQEDDLALIRDVVARNRRTLYDSLAGTYLTPCEKPFSSIAWLRIDASISARDLKRKLDARGIFVLAGDHFYWSDHRRGSGYIRVALVRDPDLFAEAAVRLAEVCRKIAIAKDVKHEIASQGFSMIAADEWIMPPASAADCERLRHDWEALEPDRYLKNGATFRRRRYGRYYWSPAENVLRALPDDSYFQPEEQNGYAGGVARVFAPLSPASAENPFLLDLIRCCFAELPIDDEKRKATWEVRVHQIRIVATPSEVGEPAPEGIHQDGTDFLTLHLMRRENVAGAESTIYDLEQRPIFRSTLTHLMDSFILQDPRIMHGVTAVRPADGISVAKRDLLGLDFIFSPTLGATGA
jgi:aspartate/methionine/tyrosine aminotransferase